MPLAKNANLNEPLFEAINEVCPLGIYVTDQNGDCIFVNKRYETISGFLANHAFEKGWVQIIHPDDREMVFNTWYDSIERKEDFDLEFRYQRPDKEIVWVHVKSRPIMDNKEVSGYIGMVQDISEQKKDKEILEQQNANLKVIIESTDACIFSVDRNYKYLVFNEIYKKTVKHNRGIDIKIGDSLLDVMSSNSGIDREKTIEFFSRVLNGDQFSNIEEYGEGDKKRAIYDVIYSPVKDDDGEIIGAAFYAVDITERIRFKDEIKDKTQLLNGILSNMPVIAYRVNADSVITYSAGAGIKAMKNGAKDYNSKKLKDINPEDWAKMQQAYIVGNVTFTSSGKAEGKEYFMENYVFQDPFDKKSLIAFSMDITKQKVYEKELIEAKSIAEEAASVKQSFLSNMSHEIRTPMNAVTGMIYLLMQENPSPAQMEYLKTLKFSADNLLVILDDILDYSKIEAGKIVFEEKDFNLFELAENIRKTNTPKAAAKDIKIKVYWDSEIPETLKGDPVRISQIMNNLVSNAVKFTNSGLITIDITLNKEDEDGYLVDFNITDTGIGISNEKQEKIFESFTQAKDDTTRKYGGTGLGLAITKRLLELQGQKITLKSKPNKGSSFGFSLKLKRSLRINLANEIPKAIKNQFQSLKGIKILLVEDNEINQMVASKIMEQWDVQIDFALNGLIALEKIQANHYDLVLMDLQMPIMDGYETTRGIRVLPDHDSSDVPIIALTASAMAEVRDKVIQAGMNGYISKPFNPAELYMTLAKYA